MSDEASGINNIFQKLLLFRKIINYALNAGFTVNTFGFGNMYMDYHYMVCLHVESDSKF